MFGNSYQNGHYFQIWDSKANNDKNDLYKQLVRIVPPSNKNYFDKQVKSYIYSLQGQTSKIVMPAVDQKQLALHQKYLVLHIFIPIGSPWSMQLGLTDINGIKRRVNLTTTQGKMDIKYFSVRYPLDNIEKGSWLFLAINVHSFIDAFKGQVFRSLDHIVVGSVCLIRRIFTMKQWSHWQIPKSFMFSSQINQQFQLIEYRQLSLPKISLNKSANYEHSPPSQIQSKQSYNKQQKAILTRSQINSKSVVKNSFAVNSQSANRKTDLVLKDKKSVVSRSHIVNQQKIKQLSKKSESVKKKSEVLLNKIMDSKLVSHSQQKPKERQKNKGQYKQLKSSPKKSPILQKSYQEDVALNFKPEEDSENNFETSHENFSNKRIPNDKKRFQQWQQQIQIQKPLKIRNKKSQRNEQKPMTKQNRAVLIRQNSQKKIQSVQNRMELQLIYDEMVGCYYHPETHTYYQIKP